MAGMVPYKRNAALTTSGFENMLDDFFGDMWPRRGSLRTFKMDVKEDDKAYTVEADLPGVKKEDIAVELEGGQLSIGVTQNETVDETDEKTQYIHRERHALSMSRSVYLPDAGSSDIKAKLNNGVLKISIPKDAKHQQDNRIPIE